MAAVTQIDAHRQDAQKDTAHTHLWSTYTPYIHNRRYINPHKVRQIVCVHTLMFKFHHTNTNTLHQHTVKHNQSHTHTKLQNL